MREEKVKSYIKIFCVAMVGAVVVIGGGLAIYSRVPHTDRYGFRHERMSEKERASEEKALNKAKKNKDSSKSGNFTVEKFDKAKLNLDKIDSRTFIETVEPKLRAHKGENYYTFDFGDGTGLYCPLSNITQTMLYGTINDKGQVTGEQLRITVTGTTVSTQKSSDLGYGALFKAVTTSIPGKYMNDGLRIKADDSKNAVEIHLQMGEGETEASARNAVSEILAAVAPNISSDTTIDWLVNDTYEYHSTGSTLQ